MELILRNFISRNWWKGVLFGGEYALFLAVFRSEPWSIIPVVVLAMLCISVVGGTEFAYHNGFRVLRSLPLSNREFGRAYWWASVGFPGLTICLATPSVALLIWACGGSHFSLFAMLGSVIFGIALWATTFHCSFVISRLIGPEGVWTRSNIIARPLLKSSFLPLPFFFNQLFPVYSPLRVLFIILCLIMAVVGWIRTETLTRVLENPVSPYRRKSQARMNSEFVPIGRGGLPFLLQNLMVRWAATYVIILGIYVVFGWIGRFELRSHQSSGWTIDTSFVWLVSALPIMLIGEIVAYLRAIRTLPISALGLAVTLVVFLSSMALLSSGITILVGKEFQCHASLVVIPCSVIVTLLLSMLYIWRVPLVITSVLIGITFAMGAGVIPILDTFDSLATAGEIAVIILAMSIAAVKWALDHGTRPYGATNTVSSFQLNL